MRDELTITKFMFDDWWTSTYIDRCTPLLPQEVEALVDYHWRELQATAIRQSLRETKEETKKVTVVCDTHGGGHIEEDDPTRGCICGGSQGRGHFEDCPLYRP